MTIESLNYWLLMQMVISALIYVCIFSLQVLRLKLCIFLCACVV